MDSAALRNTTTMRFRLLTGTMQNEPPACLRGSHCYCTRHLAGHQIVMSIMADTPTPVIRCMLWVGFTVLTGTNAFVRKARLENSASS